MFSKIKNSAVFRSVILPLIPMFLWGSLFPFVKIGYDAFSIDSSSIPDIIMFAAMRFTVCGIIVSVIAAVKRDKIQTPKWKGIGAILIMGLFSIVLHYAFTYIGLSGTDSSKTALLKQLGSLFYICFAFLFIKDEKFSVYKIIGAVIGFAGIIAINFTGGAVSFSLGDILIILASVCSVISSIISKACVKGSSPMWITGISQFSGGIILFVAALIMGGNMLTFNWKSLLVFAYICTASIIAYVLFCHLQKTASNSHLFIIKFAEPLFACIMGAILLGENIFKLQYLFAFILISAGIIIGNKGAANAVTEGEEGEEENSSEEENAAEEFSSGEIR